MWLMAGLELAPLSPNTEFSAQEGYFEVGQNGVHI